MTEIKYLDVGSKGVIRQKKLYLDSFMDMYNNEILSYRISEKSKVQAIMEGIEEAEMLILKNEVDFSTPKKF
ncbi:transposase [Enterococcus sp. DIV0170]